MGFAILQLKALIVYSDASGWVRGVYWALIRMVWADHILDFYLFFYSPFLTFCRR